MPLISEYVEFCGKYGWCMKCKAGYTLNKPNAFKKV